MSDGRLRIGLQGWGQYVTWDDLMSIGSDIDALGFDELWSNDHFLPLAAGTDGADGGLVGPGFEGWVILLGWARGSGRDSRGGRSCSAGLVARARLGWVAWSRARAIGTRASSWRWPPPSTRRLGAAPRSDWEAAGLGRSTGRSVGRSRFSGNGSTGSRRRRTSVAAASVAQR